MAVLALGVPEGTWSRALEHTVQQLTNIRGIVVVVASGNGRQDSCTVAPGPPLLWADAPPNGLRSILKLPEHTCAAAYASLARANAIKVSQILGLEVWSKLFVLATHQSVCRGDKRALHGRLRGCVKLLLLAQLSEQANQAAIEPI